MSVKDEAAACLIEVDGVTVGRQREEEWRAAPGRRTDKMIREKGWSDSGEYNVYLCRCNSKSNQCQSECKRVRLHAISACRQSMSIFAKTCSRVLVRLQPDRPRPPPLPVSWHFGESLPTKSTLFDRNIIPTKYIFCDTETTTKSLCYPLQPPTATMAPSFEQLDPETNYDDEEEIDFSGTSQPRQYFLHFLIFHRFARTV